MRTAIFTALLAIPLLAACVAAVAAGAVGGYVISNDVVGSNVYETRLNLNINKVWPIVKTTLSDASLETIEIDESMRQAKAKIDGATVTVLCEAYDLEKTIMRTRATKYAGTLNDGEMARLMQEKIIRRLKQ
jgi:hypothetical protein